MKLSEALQVQKALGAEISHLRSLETREAWSYRSTDSPNATWKPNFDFEVNHAKILKYERLKNKVGQAISRTNLEVDVIGVDNEEYSDWLK
jgi:hypothetical protein